MNRSAICRALEQAAICRGTATKTAEERRHWIGAAKQWLVYAKAIRRIA